MDPLTGLLIWLTVELGPDGALLQDALAAPETLEALPVETLAAVSPRLWVVFHEHPGPSMAFYLPATTPDAAAGGGDLRLALLASDPRFERLLPGLDVPRLFLYAPYYRRGTVVRAPPDMPLDVAEYYFRALLEAYFDLAATPDENRLWDERAAETMVGVPPEGDNGGIAPEGDNGGVPAEQRSQAYRGALAAFGAHTLSVAVELRRVLARQRSAGRDPCPALDHPGTLFALWGRIFTTEPYRGLYALPTASSPPRSPQGEGASSPPRSPQGDGPRRWVEGPALRRRDKEIFTQRFFGGAWSGDVRRDFILDCP